MGRGGSRNPSFTNPRWVSLSLYPSYELNRGKLARKKLIEKIVCHDRGQDEYIRYSSYNCNSLEVFSEPVQKTLASIPPSFGSCVMMSAGLVCALEAHYSIPAIAVLGDLKIEGVSVFKCKENIPLQSNSEKMIQTNWDGHCWVESDDVIFDLSIFRSAYRINGQSLLKNYIKSNFGDGRGAMLSPVESLPKGMEFIPKFVLNDNQISALLDGLASQQAK